jgi:cytochrome c5
MKKTYAAFVLSCAAIATNAFATNENALKLFGEKKFDQALKELMAAAKAGDAKAQYLLGIGLLQGKYFPKNEQEGLELLHSSSDAGNGEASYALFQYSNRDGRRPLSETIPMLEKAAAQGDLRAKMEIEHVIKRPDAITNVYSDLDRFVPIEVAPIGKAEMPAAMKNGQEVFQQNCATCHRTGIAGAPTLNEPARWADLRKHGFNTLVDHAINGFKAHPPRGGSFNLAGNDIRDAVLFMSMPRQQ